MGLDCKVVALPSYQVFKISLEWQIILDNSLGIVYSA